MGDIIFSLVMIALLGVAILKLVPKMTDDLAMILYDDEDEYEWDEDN